MNLTLSVHLNSAHFHPNPTATTVYTLTNAPSTLKATPARDTDRDCASLFHEKSSLHEYPNLSCPRTRTSSTDPSANSLAPAPQNHSPRQARFSITGAAAAGLAHPRATLKSTGTSSPAPPAQLPQRFSDHIQRTGSQPCYDSNGLNHASLEWK
jgi:hypothetical protein